MESTQSATPVPAVSDRDALIQAADTLHHLPEIPIPDTLPTQLRFLSSVPVWNSASTTPAASALRDVRRRVLREASLDYWLDVMGQTPDASTDAAFIDAVADVVADRARQAATLSDAIAALETVRQPATVG